MIGIALMLAAAAPQSAVEVERAFAAMAQTEGQWTAFRAFAAPEGVMFVPERTNAQQWLKDREDPPQSVMWWPGKSWVSCDGDLAVNTGPWVRSGGKSVGYFTTVWTRTADGWKWLLDHGDALASPRPATDSPKVRGASCKGTPPSAQAPAAGGASRDMTLRWSAEVEPGSGARTVAVQLWNGTSYETVLEDKVAGEAR